MNCDILQKLYDVAPEAQESAVVAGKCYRFTILTERLIRMEYQLDGHFTDSATQAIVNRRFDVPSFTVEETAATLIIKTKYFRLVYQKERPFDKNTLHVRYMGPNVFSYYDWDWYYGSNPAEDYDVQQPNLKGTIRTLDIISGEVPLDDGILSQGNFTVLDDSHSLLVREDGWVDQRMGDGLDFYLFMYARDFQPAINAFYHLTGRQPMLPRYALGNMWSRFYRYTQTSYLELMDRFRQEGVPFSVAILDMNWHLAEYDRSLSSGWTGYTWDEETFPDYHLFLQELKKRHLAIALNLHPSDGVVAYEQQYSQMAQAMGVDPASHETIWFDAADPRFWKAYFSLLLEPYEKDGVDFWWIDWQQGNTTSLKNLDPLWMLNHQHTLNHIQNEKRPMLLSRYAGPGSHRYPAGFSGDTYMDWESFQFQPYFTTCASNVGYGWWSHDIGGHMLGYRDDELAVRWTQFGVFSPLFRLHSTSSPLMGKEPWNYSDSACQIMKKFMVLRHQLIPYLYTMNRRASVEGKPLIRGLYMLEPNQPTVYNEKFRNEYLFGSEMLISPITRKSDTSTQMAYSDTYLPQGLWFDFFTRRIYPGGRTYQTWRPLAQIPAFIKAGGIIPLAQLPEDINDVSNPETIELLVFPGASNEFVLYEDDGCSLAYLNGQSVQTRMHWLWEEHPQFTIECPTGNRSLIPPTRKYRLRFASLEDCGQLCITVNDVPVTYQKQYDNSEIIIELAVFEGTLQVKWLQKAKILANDYRKDILEFALRFQGENALKDRIYNAVTRSHTPDEIKDFLLSESSMDVNIRNRIYEILQYSC